MKRIFTFFAALCIMTAAMGQRPLVTLSHNGELSFFSNLCAIDDALNTSVDGDTIYLSEGIFTTASSQYLLIKKKIHIVGCGYNSFIIGKIRVEFPENAIQMSSPLFDGVRLESVSFPLSPTRVEDLVEIRRCWIGELIFSGGLRNLTIDKCRIDYVGLGNDIDLRCYIVNSKINKLYDNPYAEIVNCNIRYMYQYPRYMANSICDNEYPPYTSGTHSIENSLLRTGVANGVYAYNCYYEDQEHLDENLDLSAEDSGKYLGQDGTVVGAMGGQFPFSVYPSVPTVDSANSSVEYDAENNKLKVKITVAPN